MCTLVPCRRIARDTSTDRSTGSVSQHGQKENGASHEKVSVRSLGAGKNQNVDFP